MLPKPEQSMPTVCFLGDGVSGSFEMRARQIASMRRHWRTVPTSQLNEDIIADTDVFCIVKRFSPNTARMLRSKRKLVVYDVVDPWKQPDDGLANDSLPRVLNYFRKRLSGCDVDGMIFPNATMCADYEQVIPNATCIYHHYRPEMQPSIVRRNAMNVGYEGRGEYLGEFAPMLERVCSKLGLRLMLNPSNFHDIDIGFAGRAGLHGSLMARRYKSNVKLANLIGAGIPAVAHRRESSYREVDNGQVELFETETELTACMQRLLSWEKRQVVHESFMAIRGKYSVDEICRQYEHYFCQLVSEAQRDSASRAA